VAGFFDNLDHALLLKIIERRVNDGAILRLIGKWLKCGVMEGFTLIHPGKGTPQGGVISPVLSNIFLHHVLDRWYVRGFAKRSRRPKPGYAPCHMRAAKSCLKNRMRKSRTYGSVRGAPRHRCPYRDTGLWGPGGQPPGLPGSRSLNPPADGHDTRTRSVLTLDHMPHL
jgi:hypothetical protein